MQRPSLQLGDPENTLSKLHRASRCLLLRSTTVVCSVCMSDLLESGIAWCAPHPPLEEAWPLSCPRGHLPSVSLCQVVAGTNGLGCVHRLAGNRRARRWECKNRQVQRDAKSSHPSTSALRAQSSRCGHPKRSHRCETRNVPCGVLKRPLETPQYCQPGRPAVALKGSCTARLSSLQDPLDSALGLHTNRGNLAPAMKATHRCPASLHWRGHLHSSNGGILHRLPNA